MNFSWAMFFLSFVRLVCIDYWSGYVSTNIVSFIINVFTRFAYELLIYQFIGTFCIGHFWLWPRKFTEKKKIYPCWQCWHRRWFGWKNVISLKLNESLLKLSQKSYCMGKPPNEPLEMCIHEWLPFFGYFISYRFELHSKVLHFQCHSFTFINDVVRTCCCRCFPPELETGKCKSDITYVFVYIPCWQSVNKNLNQYYGNSFYLCDFQCKLSTILSSNRIESIGLNIWCVLYLLPYYFASFDTFAVGSTMYNNNLSTWNRGFVRFRMINEISSFDI